MGAATADKRQKIEEIVMLSFHKYSIANTMMLLNRVTIHHVTSQNDFEFQGGEEGGREFV